MSFEKIHIICLQDKRICLCRVRRRRGFSADSSMEGGVLKTAFVLFLALVCVSFASERVIYGEDDRKEIHNSPEHWQEKALSTVALMRSSNLSNAANGKVRVSGSNYGSSYNLCANEPFREQTSAAFCSGSLIGPDLIMTAGHCIRSQSSCNSTRFVFGWGYYTPQDDLSSIDALNVYSCQTLIVTKEESSTGADYALVKLDRPVIGFSPLPLRTNGVVTPGDSLVVIGHPAGIPTKVSGGANVRSLERGYFVANLDTYGGNSGSAVFNEQTGLIEGILVRGVADFVFSNGCRKSNVCANDGCRGEEVTRVDMVLPYIPQ